jgi:transposase
MPPIFGSEASRVVSLRRLTTEQAAAYLKLAPRTISDMRSRGGGPRCRRVSHRRVLYAIADLHAWILRRDAR